MRPAQVHGDVLRSLRASPVFGFYLLVTLVVAAIIGLITFGVIDLGMTHFGEPSHRTHDVTYGLLFTTGIVGVLAQLRRPTRNVAGMVMALVPMASLLLVATLSRDFDRVVRFNPLRYVTALTVVVALLHPAGRSFFGAFSVLRISWPTLAVTTVAAVPLVGFAFTNIGLQATVTDVHGGMGHYAFMAAFSFTVGRRPGLHRQPAPSGVAARRMGGRPPPRPFGSHVDVEARRQLQPQPGLGAGRPGLGCHPDRGGGINH